MHTINLRSFSFTFIISSAALWLSASGCADDDSSATTEGSSTGTVDPTTAGPTTAVPTTTTTTSDTTAAATGSGSTAADTTEGTTSSSGPGDSESSGSTGAAGLEIAGTWFEEFSPGEGITHVIDETRWEQLASFGDATFHVDGYDNASRWLVAQGDAANEFFPGLYSRFDWTWDGDALYYCTAVYDAPTAADAQAATPSDPDDLDVGCGGFPWSPLVPVR